MLNRQTNVASYSGIWFLIISFIFSSLPIQALHAQALPFMPQPGVRVSLSPEFNASTITGLVIHPDNALRFDFLIDRGDETLTDAQKQEEYMKLVKYFMASLTVADGDQWVNLSPYEKQRIVEEHFGNTQMGRDLLAQDYLLKQITSSMMYPEDELGKSFWNKVYARAKKEYGVTDVPLSTINKVWIVPNKAEVYEKGDTVFILNSHLKVMLEEDYLALEKNSLRQSGDMFQSEQQNVSSSRLPSENALNVKAPQGKNDSTNKLTNQIVKEIILPELEKEVNEGKNFAPLRQIYSAMILSTWFKQALKESLLGKVYSDKNKLFGVELNDPKANEEIYQQYLKAYKKGAFNYIKEEVDQNSGQMIPRKYFSGGFADKAQLGRLIERKTGPDGAMAAAGIMPRSDVAMVSFGQLFRKQGFHRPGVASVNAEGYVTIDLSQQNNFDRFVGNKSEEYRLLVRNINEMKLSSDEFMLLFRVILSTNLSYLDGIIGSWDHYQKVIAKLNIGAESQAYQNLIRLLIFLNAAGIGVDYGHTDAGLWSFINDFLGIELRTPFERLQNRAYVPIVPVGHATSTGDDFRKNIILPRINLEIGNYLDSKKGEDFLNEIRVNIKKEGISVSDMLKWELHILLVALMLEKVGTIEELIETFKMLIVKRMVQYAFFSSENKDGVYSLADKKAFLEKLLKSYPAAKVQYIKDLNTKKIYSDPRRANAVFPDFLEYPRSDDKVRVVASASVAVTPYDYTTEYIPPNQFLSNLEMGVDVRSMLKVSLFDPRHNFWVFSDDEAMVVLGVNRKGLELEQVKHGLEKVRGVSRAGNVLDRAMNSSGEFGGIDLNAANLDLYIKRDGNGVPLPLPQQDWTQLQNIPGFVPIIIEIRPATTLPIISQLQAESATQLAGV